MKFAAVTLASTLLAASAFAQSGTDTGNAAKSGASGQTGASGTQSNTQSGTQSGNPSAMAQDKVRQTLMDAGFRQVEVLDASYLVRAQTEDGNTVLMVIDPPIGATSGSGTTSGSTTSGEQPKN